MHVFVDESGPFIPSSGLRTRVSAVVALAIPSARYPALVSAIGAAVGASREELKGSRLSEPEICHLLELIAAHDGIAQPLIFDGSQQDRDATVAAQALQADALIAGVSRSTSPEIAENMARLRGAILKMPLQLFVQGFLTVLLLERFLEDTTMFYSQRMPRELGEWRWRFDQKDKTPTQAEETWHELLLPLLSSRSATHPLGIIPGGDYTYWRKFDARDGDGALKTDITSVFRRDTGFVDSESDVGVQLADVVASAITRPLSGTLPLSVLKSAALLLIKRNPQTLWFGRIAPKLGNDREERFTNALFSEAASLIHKSAQGMIAASNRTVIEAIGI